MKYPRNNHLLGHLGVSSGVRPYLISAVLLVLILAVYWQVGGHPFVSFDDEKYVSRNPHVLQGLTRGGVSWASSTFYASNWHPITWLSHMLDVELFGPDPGWHHRMNVLFHLLNTELLFFVLWRMSGGLWESAFVAALFGIHPLHVESVAWVSERKDVLSTLFFLLTIGTYLRYCRRPGVVQYLILVGSFALGLLCKPMLVTLPFVLLLLDFWPLGRMVPMDSSSLRYSRSPVSRLLLEKVPLLVLSSIASVVTYLAQEGGGSLTPGSGAVVDVRILNLGVRIGNAVVSYATYLGKVVWPASLAVLYPHPATINAVVPPWKIAGAILLLAGVSLFTCWQVRRRPFLIMGWLWYLGTLVPVIGLVQVGMQSIADRYTYVPLIGIFIGVAWGIPELVKACRFRRLVLGAAGIASLLALTTVAWVQAGYWRDSITLFSRAVAVVDGNAPAYRELGLAYADSHRYTEAASCYREVLRIRPDYAPAWHELGIVYNRLGRLQEAIESYEKALQINPDVPDVWNNLGIAFAKTGQVLRAIASYEKALQIQTDFPEAWNNLGLAYARTGQLSRAIASYEKALQIKPEYTNAWFNLGMAYQVLGQTQQAESCFREAERLRSLSNSGNPA